MKYFCSKCGKTTQYNFELPKFCAFCGQSFANKPASPSSDEQRDRFLNELKLKKNIINNHTPDSDIETSINFKNIKAQYKLDIYKSQGESFGSLIDNPSAPTDKSQDINNYNNNQKTSEQIFAEFQKEASSVRNKE